MAYKNPIENANAIISEGAPAAKTKYYRHPELHGVWHDTGKKHPLYPTHSIYENEEGHPWAVSEEFAKQHFVEVPEPQHPFKLDKQKYPDVEETPYGFIYNVGNRSLTDTAGQARKFGNYKEDKNYGWTLTSDGDEVYYPSFEEAYAAAKGGK